VLTQIIVEQESKGQNLLPIRFLRQLIRFYGDSIERIVPSYLEMSLDSLAKDQDRIRKQFANTFGANAFDALHEQTRQNIAMFERALSMFSPFGTAGNGAESASSSPPSSSRGREDGGPQESSTSEDLQRLKDEMTRMQEKLDKLTRG
ncbi:MAG: polyhydroxyalkanoate synthesis repressor PhaR, partial [Alphaproteobacteria bacterium]